MKQKTAEEKFEITKCCAYCEKATLLSGDDYVLCSKKGVVALTYVCRRFSYDPLKVMPKRPAKYQFENEEEPEMSLPEV